MKTITVFGSARVQPGHDDYEAAYALGRALAGAGFAVMSGGYYGIMAAVSKGASELGGHTIGITTNQIEALSGVRANPWIKQEVKYPILGERINHLILQSDGYIAMPGGVGTLHEIAETWEMLRLEEIMNRPLICYGAYWETILSGLRSSIYVPHELAGILRFAHSVEAVMDILNGA